MRLHLGSSLCRKKLIYRSAYPWRRHPRTLRKQSNKQDGAHNIRDHGIRRTLPASYGNSRFPAYSVSDGWNVCLRAQDRSLWLFSRTQYSLDDKVLLSRGLRIVGLIGTVGLVLAISGGVSAGNATSQSSLDNATTQRHVGVILFVVMYVGAVGLTLLCWQDRHLILRYRRQVSVRLGSCYTAAQERC